MINSNMATVLLNLRLEDNLKQHLQAQFCDKNYKLPFTNNNQRSNFLKASIKSINSPFKEQNAFTLGIFSRKSCSLQKFAMHLGQRKTTQAYKKIQDGGRE